MWPLDTLLHRLNLKSSYLLSYFNVPVCLFTDNSDSEKKTYPYIYSIFPTNLSEWDFWRKIFYMRTIILKIPFFPDFSFWWYDIFYYLLLRLKVNTIILLAVDQRVDSGYKNSPLSGEQDLDENIKDYCKENWLSFRVSINVVHTRK